MKFKPSASQIDITSGIVKKDFSGRSNLRQNVVHGMPDAWATYCFVLPDCSMAREII